MLKFLKGKKSPGRKRSGAVTTNRDIYFDPRVSRFRNPKGNFAKGPKPDVKTPPKRKKKTSYNVNIENMNYLAERLGYAPRRTSPSPVKRYSPLSKRVSPIMMQFPPSATLQTNFKIKKPSPPRVTRSGLVYGKKKSPSPKSANRI